MDQLGQLRHEDQNGQRVDEAGDHRARYETHQAAELQSTGHDLQQTSQQRGREQVLQPVLLDQAHHHQRHRAGRRRDHTGTTAGEGDDHGDRERGIETDLGVDTGDDRKRDRLGNQGQGNDESGEHIAAQIGQPGLTQGTDQHEYTQRFSRKAARSDAG